MPALSPVSVTEPEIFVELCAVIAQAIHYPDADGTFYGLWIKESTPLTGDPPPDSCGYDPGYLGGLASVVNASFPLNPQLNGSDLVGLNAGQLASLICKNYDYKSQSA